MERIIRVKQSLYNKEDFEAEILVNEETTREQLNRAKELFYEYLREDKESGKYIDYESILREALTDVNIKFKYVPHNVWYV